ncbi:3-oxoacyl-[acyl-carrier-protein] synthase III C-terminal domain-containing protein [Streptomyces sp. NPDC003006]
MTESYVRDIRIEAGNPTPLENVVEAKDPEILSKLKEGGIRQVLSFADPLWKVASVCAKRTVSAAETPIDTVLLASDSRRELDGPAPDSALRFLLESGLNGAMVMGAGLNRCANFGSLLLAGRSLVTGNQSDGCLLVSAEATAEGFRLQEDGFGIFSDAAATALVSREPGKGPCFRVIGVQGAASAELALVSNMHERPEVAVAFFEAIQRAFSGLGVEPEEYSAVVANNYIVSAVQGMMEVIDVPFDRVVREPAAYYSHCHSADGLIGLDHLIKSGELADGDKVLVLSTAVNTWFFTALEYVAAGA